MVNTRVPIPLAPFFRDLFRMPCKPFQNISGNICFPTKKSLLYCLTISFELPFQRKQQQPIFR